MLSKKIFLRFFCFILLFISCKQLEDAVGPVTYKAPEIKSLTLRPDTAVNPLDTLQIIVVAENPEDDLLTYSWAANGGLFIPPANKDTVLWVAPLSGGKYTITIKVENKRKSDSRDIDVTVQSPEKALINIIEPIEDQYFILGSEINVVVEAFHPNGLSYVRLFAADSVVDQKNYDSSNNYSLSFITVDAMVGELTLKAETQVFNQPENISSDIIRINIEGILPKQEKP